MQISTLILLFEGSDKKIPSSYRSTNLLYTTSKLVTRILTSKIKGRIILPDEGRFRSERSYTDAIFVLIQITEKSINYNRPVFIFLIDMEKDQIQLEHGMHLLYNRRM